MAHRYVIFVMCTACFAPGCQAGIGGEMAADEGDEDDTFDDVSSPDAPAGGVGGADRREQPGGEGGSATTDAAAAPEDAAAAAPQDALAVPAGKVGVFVAAGNGGRTVTSCDDGNTWKAEEIIVNTNDDHSPYTHKGFAFGDGNFVHVSGWGTHARIKRSHNGVTWEKSELPGFSFGGVGFSQGVFVGMESFSSRVSRDGGKTWQAGGPTNHGYHVRGAGGAGLAVAAGGNDSTPVTSWDQGKSFAKATGCPGMDYSNLGQRGGVAFGANALVLVSAKGGFCKLVQGKVEKTGSVGGAVAGKVAWVGDKFYAPTGGRAFVSVDGENWQTVVFKPAGLNINIVARGASGTYVGITQSDTGFFRSEDGIAWQRVPGPTGPRLVDLAYGVVEGSASCPAP